MVALNVFITVQCTETGSTRTIAKSIPYSKADIDRLKTIPRCITHAVRN
jgi:hypothetical protein